MDKVIDSRVWAAIPSKSVDKASLATGLEEFLERLPFVARQGGLRGSLRADGTAGTVSLSGRKALKLTAREGVELDPLIQLFLRLARLNGAVARSADLESVTLGSGLTALLEREFPRSKDEPAEEPAEPAEEQAND